MRLLYASDNGLLRRAAGGGTASGYIIVGVVVAALVLIVAVFVFARGRKSKAKGYRPTGDMEVSSNSRTCSRQLSPNFDAAIAQANCNNNRNSTAANVDRNTSVRSVMTLPAYRTRANDNEQVLGREGERDGVDVVLELPNIQDDESLRENEMEAMYQIRLARGREIADREERRRQRREARSRGDMVALSEISERARAASQSSAVSELRSEHEQIKKQRQRAVSSVSYADLGVARHDGTRLRANSTESERVGLLSDAASITLSTRSPSSNHQRDRSASSVGFESSMPRSGATTPRLNAQFTGSSTGAGSSPEITGEADLGDADMPPYSPPGYDDVSLDNTRSGATTPLFKEPPPDYPGPSQERDRRLNSYVAEMIHGVADDGDLSRRSSTQSTTSPRRFSQGAGGVTQLPCLRIGALPQIIVEQPSAHPRDRSR